MDSELGEFVPDFEDVESMFKVDYNGLTIYGEGMPSLDDIKLSYRQAWKCCKEGCLCFCRNIMSPKASNCTYFAVCDGTDPVNFLVLNPTSKDSTPVKITFGEILSGYWVWKKCRLFYVPSDKSESKSNPMVIEGLSPLFFESLLKCTCECYTMLKETNQKLDQTS
ncbi:hypothetical protein TpMuguga_01g01153 [Theileria parva strain Muguga]|uniref:Uncharacterized protein n=1 Tax=Theileria parva TaxID=5875 RepID=Q4N6L7_THEPA|nr:uncharacterized protein TpMuguga_01g01153 [Theileria parva strain Muguga]EAN34391.1 hypothetical protein TpMuguga_01g01153 [Theileria parva strain Muguga]|eukprot:XP_766674.1 hypothetical protein [Theileria parva strain Muguga]